MQALYTAKFGFRTFKGLTLLYQLVFLSLLWHLFILQNKKHTYGKRSKDKNKTKANQILLRYAHSQESMLLFNIWMKILVSRVRPEKTWDVVVL